ncbi:MAG: S41 family peptidase [Patescibacteria group bacterium]|nr:S41 family peptidase [Patescibacteria group bacterium]
MEQELNKNIQEIKRAPKTKKQRRKFFLFVIAIVIAFYVGVAWGKGITEQKSETSQKTANFIKNLSDPTDIFGNADKNKPEEVDFNIFWDAWKKIDKGYIDKDKLDPQARVYGAISGMVGALGDPYSGFMDPEETKDFSTDMEGSFEGIGAELGMKDGILTIIAPIEGMPAEKAGLRAGDKIIKINDDIASDITINKAVKKIRGKKGTDVSLTILRGDETTTREITITRSRIEIKSAIYEKKDDSIAYIKIKKFADDTSKEFNKAVSMAIADNTKGIILDLRNNPGGFLNISVDMTSKFVPKGEVVVWERKGDGSMTSYKARGGNSLSGVPVVILINEGSASASEIMAGALRDINQAILIGKKSFGKGSVQQLESLRDGSSLRITIAKWLTPLEKSIHEVGLEPDIEVELTNEDFENKRDPQYDCAMEEIKKIIQ